MASSLSISILMRLRTAGRKTHTGWLRRDRFILNPNVRCNTRSSHVLDGSRSFLRLDQIMTMKSAMNGHGNRSIHTLSGASVRDMVELEDRVHAEVGSKVQDPLLQKDLKSLQWMHRRLAVSDDDTIQILLKIPTLLHPSLNELKNLVKSSAENEIKQWLTEKGLSVQVKVNVEVVPEKVEIDEDERPNEVSTNLGPGLSNVRHFLAVYSCKVRYVTLRCIVASCATTVFQSCSYRLFASKSLGWSWQIDCGSESCIRTG